MKQGRLLSDDFIAHQMPKQGKRQKRIVDKELHKKRQEIKDICLNCEKEKCSGYCKNFRRYK